jgi:hypothetical protein
MYTIIYTYISRLDESSEKRKRVDLIVSVLGLDSVRLSRVGSVDNRGDRPRYVI